MEGKNNEELYRDFLKKMERALWIVFHESEHVCLNDFLRFERRKDFEQLMYDISTGEGRAAEVNNPHHVTAIRGISPHYKSAFMPFLIENVQERYVLMEGTHWSVGRENFFYFLCETLALHSSETDSFRKYFNRLIRQHR